MPWSAKQNKVFRAREHGWIPDDPKLSGIAKMSQAEAKKLAHEGISREMPRKRKGTSQSN